MKTLYYGRNRRDIAQFCPAYVPDCYVSKYSNTTPLTDLLALFPALTSLGPTIYNVWLVPDAALWVEVGNCTYKVYYSRKDDVGNYRSVI